MKEISPSMLPKLAECPAFVGASGASEAAARGTKLDEVIRELACGWDYSAAAELPEEDKTACLWGAGKLKELAGQHKVETREEFLAMHVPQLSRVGTADAACWEGKWVADIKTGQLRNYREQLAAYALACMDARWEESWTAHVIYVDQQLVRSYEFSRDDAERIVDQVISRAASTLHRPMPCEYCDWCASKNDCPALVRQALAMSREIWDRNPSKEGKTIEDLKRDITKEPARLSEFVRRWKWFDKEFGEPLSDELKQRLEAGDNIDGWSLTTRQGGEYVELAAAMPTLKQATPEQVFAVVGKLSGKQFRELCAQVGVQADESAIQRGAPTTYLRASKRKEN